MSPTSRERAREALSDDLFAGRVNPRDLDVMRRRSAQEIDDAVAAEREAKDEAYRERNQVVAALASMFPAGVARTDIPGWDPEWHGCVYIDLPTGQVSWHFHEREAHLFAELPAYTGTWDGHDTQEKYRRLAAMSAIRARTQKAGG